MAFSHTKYDDGICLFNDLLHEIEKNLNYLLTHKHTDLILVVHPIMYAYLTKGGLFKSKLWKWRWKHKQRRLEGLRFQRASRRACWPAMAGRRATR